MKFVWLLWLLIVLSPDQNFRARPTDLSKNTSEHVQILFFDNAAGHAKNLVSGEEERLGF